ncbi:MAG: hypothetical protein ACD_73C00539G0001 [uncultured bacterium]|nr:MAG: hypothetical protein ACD_73C00539G0001 [uncultured bacterium]
MIPPLPPEPIGHFKTFSTATEAIYKDLAKQCRAHPEGKNVVAQALILDHQANPVQFMGSTFTLVEGSYTVTASGRCTKDSVRVYWHATDAEIVPHKDSKGSFFKKLEITKLLANNAPENTMTWGLVYMNNPLNDQIEEWGISAKAFTQNNDELISKLANEKAAGSIVSAGHYLSCLLDGNTECK